MAGGDQPPLRHDGPRGIREPHRVWDEHWIRDNVDLKMKWFDAPPKAEPPSRPAVDSKAKIKTKKSTRKRKALLISHSCKEIEGEIPPSLPFTKGGIPLFGKGG